MSGTINRLRPPAAPRTTRCTMSRSPAPNTPARTPRENTREAYLVLGMHRSGTSAVTQLLALAGASLPKNVMPGDEHNAKGYFEPWKIALFDDERLRAGGSAWDDVFAFPFRALPQDEEAAWLARGSALFDEEFGRARWPLMKDPRATVLLPLWREVLAARGVGLRCVIPVRHPLAVAGSLRRRNGFPDEKSVLVWSAYMLAAEAYTRDAPRAFVGYDALLADWRAEAAKIEAAHGAPLPRLTAAAAREIDRFLTPDLRHNAGGGGLADLGWAGAIAQDVLDWMEARAAGGDPDPALLARAAGELGRRQAEFGMLVSPAARDLDAARSELLAARQRLEYADHLETGWRADLERMQTALAELAELEAGLDAPYRG
jgi:hypothetical protein